MADTLDCNIRVSDSGLHYGYFWTNTIEEKYELFYPH